MVNGKLPSAARVSGVATLFLACPAIVALYAAWDTVEWLSKPLVILIVACVAICTLAWTLRIVFTQGEAVARATSSIYLIVRGTLRDNRLQEAQNRNAVQQSFLQTRAMKAIVGQIEKGLVYAKEATGFLKTDSFPVPVITQSKQDALPQPNKAEPPNHVELSDVLSAQSSVRKLVIGSTAEGVLKCDILQLFHILIAGTSRWGKSIFLQSLLYQALTAKEDMRLYLIDPAENTFPPFGIPFSSTKQQIEETLSDVWQETQSRKDKFASLGRSTPRTLEQYNTITGEALPHILVLIDEATGLLDKKSQYYSEKGNSLLGNVAQFAAKYGIYLVLSGQDMKHDVLPTSQRNQYQTRIQFKAMDHNQARVLIPDSTANQFQYRGRCDVAINDIGETIQVQTPYVPDQMILDLDPVLISQRVYSPVQTHQSQQIVLPSDIDAPLKEAAEIYLDGGQVGTAYRRYYEEKHGKPLSSKVSQSNRKMIARKLIDEVGIDLRAEDEKYLS